MIIKPNSVPQEKFLASSEYEVLYGGAAGGGKTEALIIDPLRYIHISDFCAIFFRESFPQLEKAVIPEAKKIYLNAGAKWNDTKRRFIFPSGAFIDLTYLDTPDAWTNLQGAPYVGQYFDELTTMHWTNYDKLAAWNRAAGSGGVLPYRRATSNPGNISHAQVKSYFVDTCPPQKDGEMKFSDLANMYWQPMKPGKTYTWTAENGNKLTRKFIPSRVFDNTDLLKNNPNYLAQLLKLDPDMRKAFLEGDWDIFSGQFFSTFRKEKHVISNFKPNKSFAKIGGLDYGRVKVLEVMERDYNGRIVNFFEWTSENQSPTDAAKSLCETLLENELYKLQIIYDTDMDIVLSNTYEFTRAPIFYFREISQQMMKDKAPIFTCVTKRKSEGKDWRVACNEAVKEFLQFTEKQNPNLLFTNNCKEVINEISLFIHDEKDKTGLDFVHDNNVIDHAFDAFKIGFMNLFVPLRPKLETYKEKLFVGGMANVSQSTTGKEWMSF